MNKTPSTPGPVVVEAAVDAALDPSGTVSPTILESATVPDIDHRAERGRRLKWSILTTLLVKPLAVITPIITVRLFVNYLGTERYGLYESVAALAVWLSLTNIGLTLGLMNKLTECQVSGNRELARRYVSSLSLALLAMVMIGFIIVALATPLVNWQLIFPSKDPLGRAETPWAVLISGWSTLFGLMLSIPATIYIAHQESYRANLWDGVAKIATLIACVAVVWTRWGLVGVIAASAATPVLMRIPNALVFFGWEYRWLTPRLRYFDWTLLKGTMKHGLGLFFIQMSSMAIFQADKMIISMFLGQEDVARYAIAGRLFLMVYGLYIVLFGPLWPAYAEALRRGDRQWVRKALERSLLFGVSTTLLCGVAMFFFGNQILKLWTRGAQIEVSRSLVLALTSLFLMWTCMAGLSILLNAAGVVRKQANFIGAHALLNVILAAVLARKYGVVGVAWAMPITGLLTSAWGYPWLTYRYVWRPKPATAKS